MKKKQFNLKLYKIEEIPKPTVALEYCFGRRSNQSGSSKDIVHIWELAGGLKLNELLGDIIKNDNQLKNKN